MRILLSVLILFSLTSPALAIEISEEMLNAYVKQRLAQQEQKGQRDVRVIDPKISLMDGYATICAGVKAKVLPREVGFCANMTPEWRRETGSLLATKMSLVSLSAPGVAEKDIDLLKAVVNMAILPKLEGREIYKADDFIGKQVSGLKVLPGKLDISM